MNIFEAKDEESAESATKQKGRRTGKGNPQLLEEVDFGPRLGFHRVDSHESSLESVREHLDVSWRIFLESREERKRTGRSEKEKREETRRSASPLPSFLLLI